MKIIIISGIDGAGKSTQLRLLKRYLKKNGFKVYYSWLRWFAFITYAVYLYAKILKRTLLIESRTRQVHIHVFWRDKALKYLYPRILLFDLIIWYYVKKLIATLKRVDILIFDRGFLDVIIDLLWDIRTVDFLESFITKKAWKIIISTQTIVITVSPNVAIVRKKDIISLKELYFKKKCFEVFSKYINFNTIDTTDKNILETFSYIIKVIDVQQ